ncbi:RNA-directed DNA polymerase [Candidatus Saccharibacteria bacterium]|nr:RNA-directed DNA polymerase [Candidatus Saccharibacteria bacterium]
MDDFYHLIDNAEDADIRAWLTADPKNLLFTELFIAELAARKGGKRKTYDTHAFEVNLFENLTRLRDALWNYEYHPSRGTAHVIFRPVQREIFAAPYVDRVTHHFVVGAIIDWWENRLSYESCSCRVGRGTSFGIERLAHHIRSVSRNFTRPCYVVKMDISGYFMHIQRDILFHRVIWGLDQQFANNKGKRYKMLKHAIHEIIFDDPVNGVKIQGSYEDWRGLPEDKSLFLQPPGQGMVIGNLTSQFFSNIYLDPLDRFVTMDLGYKHYGRYVDDFYVVITEDQIPQALKDVKVISTFLQGFGMKLNYKKTRVIPSWQGVPFLGMVIRDRAILPGKRMTNNFTDTAHAVVAGTKDIESIISYLGMLTHYDAGRATDRIFKKVGWTYFYK